MAHRFYAYTSSPGDYWDGWVSLPGFIRRLVGLELAEEAPFSVETFTAYLLEAACTVATLNHPDWGDWEGDVRGNDMYVALRGGRFPATLDEVVVGWKQDNNGTTFFASRQPIPALEGEDPCDGGMVPQI